MKILSLSLILTFSQIGFSQTFDKAKLDTYFNTLEENNKYMGSVAVSKNGEIIYTKTIGFADIENNIKATENSKYRIGSITKTFTSVLVLKAVEENKLTLNQSIDKWFPEIENANEITLEQLLNHRSGIYNLTNSSDYSTWNTQPKTERELLEKIKKGGSVFKPNSKAEYSNSNFILLTYILEKTYSKSYADLIQEYIAKPLDLINTSVFGKIEPLKNESYSYKWTGTWELEPETDFTIPLGAGAILSTPTDLTKFGDALFTGKLLQAESLEKMKNIKDGYGLGLFPINFSEKRGYGHTGGIDGFTSAFVNFPNDKLSYALISNGANFNNNNISIAVLNAVFNQPYEIPVFTEYKLTSEDLDMYLGVYASSLVPMKITITKNENTLIAQATGQPSFPLQATEKNKFKFEQAGLNLEFNPTEKTVTLFQGGGQVVFTKEDK